MPAGGLPLQPPSMPQAEPVDLPMGHFDLPPMPGPKCGEPTDVCPGQRIIELPVEPAPRITDALAIDSEDRGTKQTTIELLRDLIAPARVTGVDVLLNIQTAGLENFAVVQHGLNSESVLVSLLTTLGSSWWTVFGATWQVVTPNELRISFAHEFHGPARAVIQTAGIIP